MAKAGVVIGSMRINKAILIGGIIVAVASFVAGMLYNRGTGTMALASRPSDPVASEYTCPMHPEYRSKAPGDCPLCGMRLVAADTAEESATGGHGEAGIPSAAVRVSLEKQQLIGVRTDVVERAPMVTTLRTIGRVATDETRVYRVSAATSGWISKALPNSVGSLVAKDATLATYYAREFLGVQQSYFYALSARDRFLEQKASEAQMAATNVQIDATIDNLRALGMSDRQIEEIGRTRQRTYEIEIRSPATGFVLERNVSPGQRFESGAQLYTIADLRKVWILADLFENEARFVHARDVPVVRYQGEATRAVVSDVLPTFDSSTRTLKVRLELDNPGYRFRPDMFVDVEFQASAAPSTTVPVDAVVDSGVRATVFVAHGNGIFEPRAVRTGWRLDDRVQIVDGLQPGETIVVAGTFLLDSETRLKHAPTNRPRGRNSSR